MANFNRSWPDREKSIVGDMHSSSCLRMRLYAYVFVHSPICVCANVYTCVPMPKFKRFRVIVCARFWECACKCVRQQTCPWSCACMGYISVCITLTVSAPCEPRGPHQWANMCMTCSWCATQASLYVYTGTTYKDKARTCTVICAQTNAYTLIHALHKSMTLCEKLDNTALQ